MNGDDWQMYLDALTEQRKTPREREIEKEMNELAARRRRELEDELKPLLDELVRINVLKPPMPILHEGKIFEHVGPHHED